MHRELVKKPPVVVYCRIRLGLSREGSEMLHIISVASRCNTGWRRNEQDGGVTMGKNDVQACSHRRLDQVMR